MNDEYAILKIHTDSLEVFVACIVLGTLREVREGNIPLETGVWSLARPVFSGHPDIADKLPKDLNEILQGADELDALSKLKDRDAADAVLDKWINMLQALVKKSDSTMWSAKWCGLDME